VSPLASHPRRAGRLPGGVEHGVDLDATEAAGVNLVEQLRRSVGRGEGRPVGPVLAHGVVGVGGGQQPRAQGELVSRSTAVVPGAVGSLVAACGEVGEGGKERAAVQDPFAEVGMQPGPFPLLGTERAGPVPDSARDTDAPDVVHQCGSTKHDGIRL